MQTKICCDCKKELPFTSFNINKEKKDGLQYSCRECRKIYNKIHYKQNKEKYKNQVIQYRKNNKERYQKYKSTLKCNQCNEKHPSCLQFHHKDNNKEYTIASIARCCSVEKLQIEIDKCIVLCANCHAKLHYNLIKENSNVCTN
jgi:hypothetical protein